mgnify:CR=1 FL=1
MPRLRPSEGKLMPPKSEDKCGVTGCHESISVTTPDGSFCVKHFSQRLERKYREAVGRLL